MGAIQISTAWGSVGPVVASGAALQVRCRMRRLSWGNPAVLLVYADRCLQHWGHTNGGKFTVHNFTIAAQIFALACSLIIFGCDRDQPAPQTVEKVTQPVTIEEDIKGAADYVRARMFKEAMPILEKYIKKTPTDAKAHYLLGECYLNLGRYPDAERRFDSAVAIDAAYRHSIGESYLRCGSRWIEKADFRRAEQCLDHALAFFPKGKLAAAEQMYQMGVTQFQLRRSADADQWMLKAKLLAPELAGKIHVAETAYGRELLQAAKKLPHGQRGKLMAEAGKYLDQKAIEAVFPPPKWYRILRLSTVGRGMADMEAIPFIQSGDQFTQGDRIVFSGDAYWLKVGNGGWKRYEGRFEMSAVGRDDGRFIYVNAPEGTEVSVEIHRLLTPEAYELGKFGDR